MFSRSTIYLHPWGVGRYHKVQWLTNIMELNMITMKRQVVVSISVYSELFGQKLFGHQKENFFA